MLHHLLNILFPMLYFFPRTYFVTRNLYLLLSFTCFTRFFCTSFPFVQVFCCCVKQVEPYFSELGWQSGFYSWIPFDFCKLQICVPKKTFLRLLPVQNCRKLQNFMNSVFKLFQILGNIFINMEHFHMFDRLCQFTRLFNQSDVCLVLMLGAQCHVLKCAHLQTFFCSGVLAI